MCVMPAGMTSSSGNFKIFSYLPTVNEMELISAVISGHLDPSVMASAPGKCFSLLIYPKVCFHSEDHMVIYLNYCNFCSAGHIFMLHR